VRMARSVVAAIGVAAPIAGGWIQAVHKESPELVPVFEQLAARLNLSGHKAADAAAQMMFDHDGTLWMQGAINRLNPSDPPLEVDGVYGPFTKAAVEKFQRAHPPTRGRWLVRTGDVRGAEAGSRQAAVRAITRLRA